MRVSLLAVIALRYWKDESAKIIYIKWYFEFVFLFLRCQCCSLLYYSEFAFKDSVHVVNVKNGDGYRVQKTHEQHEGIF